jgi:hypothetical protein
MLRRVVLLPIVLLTGCTGGASKDSAAPAGNPVAATLVLTPIPTTPPPTATPIPTANPISYVRVGFYGIRCPGGEKGPDNARKELPMGCQGSVTATPKREDGTDVHSSEHGMDITWELVHGSVSVRVFPQLSGEPFNRELVPSRPGGFMLCATVKGVMGCLSGEVTP